MKRHDNAALFRYRNDTFQEIFNVFPKVLFLLFHHRHGSIHGLHPVYSWNPTLEDECHLLMGPRPFICSQYITRLVEPSSASFVKLCSCPVKYRHKIICHTFNPVFCASADRLAIILNMTVSSRSSKFDLFRYRNGFYNIKN